MPESSGLTLSSSFRIIRDDALLLVELSKLWDAAEFAEGFMLIASGANTLNKQFEQAFAPTNEGAT